MADLSVFPDAIALVIDALDDMGTVGTRTNLQTMPFIRVVGLPSGEGNLITDVSMIEVAVFAPTYAAASLLSRQIQQRLISVPRAENSGVLDKVTTLIRPFEIPYDDPNIRVIAATYRVSARR